MIQHISSRIPIRAITKSEAIMTSLNKLERDILATLEEAGEDDLASLLNTVREGHGSSDEINAFRIAVTHLIKDDFLEIARFRDKISQHWNSVPKPESVALAAGLASLLHWSAGNQLWNFPDGSPRLQVVLTDAGLVAAREILSQDGWPVRKLWGGLE
jgi:hypothetical protein